MERIAPLKGRRTRQRLKPMCGKEAMFRTRSARISLALLIAASLGACSAVDSFSTRSVQYNLEAEQSQDQGLLLNILRSMKQRPLQFSGVQSVSGTASAQGTAAISWPLREYGGKIPGLLNPGATISGGPTFAVGILDTQEFFQ